MEVQSSFETKVTLTPEDFTLLANDKSRDDKAKRRDGYGSIDQVIEKKIKESYEGKCSRSGYVLPNSVKLLSRSVGMIEKGRFTGDVLFYAEATCKVYQPPEGVILGGRVTHKNRMGIYVDYNDHAIRIMVPRDLHIGNEEFDSIDVGDLVKVEIKKSRYQVNDVSILSVGVFKGRATKPGYYGFEGKEEVEAVAALGLAKREQLETPDEVKERDVLDVVDQELVAPVELLPKPAAGSTDLFFYATLPTFKEFDPLFAVQIKYTPKKGEGATYPSVEHFMQEKKFDSKQSGIIGLIRAQPTAVEARRIGTSAKIPLPKIGLIDIGPKHLRKDWDTSKDELMEAIQTQKFEQHPDLAKMLIDTRDRKLVYADPYDSYWGAGKDGLGQNKLGEILMKIRKRLVKEQAKAAETAPAEAAPAATAKKSAPAKKTAAKPATVVLSSEDTPPATKAKASVKPVVVAAPPAAPTKTKKKAAPVPVVLSPSPDAESDEEDSD